jgi:L-alanine-DL-glutamate epimerase-like enolase superfamily enzyme
MALWDLKAKLLGLPMALLLGGERTVVDAYASGGWTSLDDGELVDEACTMVDNGYSKIKIKVGVDAGTNPRRDLRRVAAVREAVGDDVTIMLDANNCWTAAVAAQFANRAREYDIFFLEEPVIADDIPGLARFRAATDVPLATGEHEYSRFGARDLIASGAVDVLQLDMTRAGGVTEMIKVVSLAQAWNLPIAPHGMDVFHLPLVAAYPNSLFVENLLIFEEVTEAVFVDPPRPVMGQMTVPDRPGFGLTLNEEVLRGTR